MGHKNRYSGLMHALGVKRFQISLLGHFETATIVT